MLKKFLFVTDVTNDFNMLLKNIAAGWRAVIFLSASTGVVVYQNTCCSMQHQFIGYCSCLDTASRRLLMHDSFMISMYTSTN
jgi:hypothetical protein